MKNLIRNIVIAAAAVVGAVSCTESGVNDDIKPNFEGVTLHATAPGNEDPSTKVDFTDEGKDGIILEWSAEDSFILYDAEGSMIDTFTTAEGDGVFVSSNPELQLVNGATYTAKFNGGASTAKQNGDEINCLSKACQMEAEFTYSNDAVIAFAHTKAIMTFQFTSEELPAYLIFKDGEKSYEVDYYGLTPDASGIYTSHIMIEPSDATPRMLIFSLYDNYRVAYDVRMVDTDLPFEKGVRYTSPVSTLADNSWLGSGTEDDPYQISTATQLRALSEQVSETNIFMGKYFILTDDIDLGGIDAEGNCIAHKEFTPIGTNYSNCFGGSFDGAGHTISGLYVDNPESDYQGLFGYVKGATIQNLSVVGSVTGRDYVAGVVAYPSSCLVINCSNAVTVKGGYNVGGVAGFSGGTTLFNCRNTASVVGGKWVGGIVGLSKDSSVINCYNTASYVGSDSSEDVGGIMGSSGGAKIVNSYNTASVKGANYIGGIVGHSTILSIFNCYNASSVVGTSCVGGIVGGPSPSDIITSCFWNTSVADAPADGVGITRGTLSEVEGMTTDQMQSSVFVATLTDNASIYNGPIDEDIKKACAWQHTKDGFPIHDFSTAPKGTQEFEGEGTQSSPYKISTAGNLRKLSQDVCNNVTYKGKYFIMTDNIDLSGIDANGNGVALKKFTPIGVSYTNYFGGTFDGAGHTISGLYVYKPGGYGDDFQGLFGYLREATIKNLSVAGIVHCKNGSYIGGIVGKLESSLIINCFNAASVVGYSQVGSIVGSADESSVINCYNRAYIEGYSHTGGIVGCADDTTVSSCYNAASIKGYGIVGQSDSHYTLTSYCYWDNSIANSPTKALGSYSGVSFHVGGVTTAQMQSSDFVTMLNNSAYLYNESVDDETKKACAWQAMAGGSPIFDFSREPTGTKRFEGDGTQSSPYKISTVEDLTTLAYDVNNKVSTYEGKYFTVTRDIDMGGIDAAGNGIAQNEFTPIGKTDEICFSGTLDGAGHTISGLYVDNYNSVYQGLFGIVNGATIKDLTVAGLVNDVGYAGGFAGKSISSAFINCCNKTLIVNSSTRVGGIVGGAFSSSFTSCYNTASIVADSYSFNIGGVVGEAASSSLINCYNTASVKADTNSSNVGGVVGYSNKSSINNCYNTATVKGVNDIGGVVGSAAYASLVTNCYNTAAVDGTDSVGGVVGVAGKASVVNCYNTASVKGSRGVGGVVGNSSIPSSATNCYWNTSVADAPEIGIGIDYGTSSNIVAMTTTEMQKQSFSGILNINAYNYNTQIEGDKPELEACAWLSNGGGYPVLNFGVEAVDMPLEYNQADDVYEICSGYALVQFAEMVNNGETEIDGKLMCDIDLKGSANNVWTPMGTEGNGTGYAGVFDGDGYTISGLYVTGGTANGRGLFGVVYGGTIKNLTVDGTVDSQRDDVAGIAGYARGAVFENCKNNADIRGPKYVGGIVGYCSPYGSMIIKKCVNAGNVESTGSYAGGIAGKISYWNETAGNEEKSHTIESCANWGSVTAANEYAGGLAGMSLGGFIHGSYSRGNIEGASKVGGLVGENCAYYYNDGSHNIIQDARIYFCYARAWVTGDSDTGLLIGYQQATYPMVSAYYNGSWEMPAVGNDAEYGGVKPCTYFPDLVDDLNVYSKECRIEPWVLGSGGYPILEFEQ